MQAAQPLAEIAHASRSRGLGYLCRLKKASKSSMLPDRIVSWPSAWASTSAWRPGAQPV